MKRVLSLWITVVVVLVPWVAFGQESEPPPAAQPLDRIADTYAALMAMLDRRPELYPLIIWPVFTAIVSFAQDAIKARAPMLWAVLQKIGVDLLGFLRIVWPKNAPKLPPPAGPATLLLLVVALGGVQAGCASQEKLSRVLEAGRDVAAKAEPCFVEMQGVDVAACREDAACVAKVKESWAPVADALDLLHEFWCATTPDSDGCK
ncbi:MAG: hypothetical protein ACRCU1_03495 [Alsobacter sp.]